MKQKSGMKIDRPCKKGDRLMYNHILPPGKGFKAKRFARTIKGCMTANSKIPYHFTAHSVLVSPPGEKQFLRTKNTTSD